MEGKTIRETCDNNPTTFKSIRYYACFQNSLYEMQFCDTMGGLNHALPPDILHAVLLGWVTRLINGFTCLKKIENDKMFVFSDAYKEEIERDLLAVGHAFSKQSDVDLPCMHFPSGYLPNIHNKKEDNGSGKKNAHELRGVLLTILGFLLLHGQLEKLNVRIGGNHLSGFIKVMEITLLLEAWLNNNEFCEDDLCCV